MIHLPSSEKFNLPFLPYFLIIMIREIQIEDDFFCQDVRYHSNGTAHSTDLKISPNNKLSFDQIFFIKKTLNYIKCDFIYCPTTVLHGIYHHKYSFYQLQTYLWVTILFKRC